MTINTSFNEPKLGWLEEIGDICSSTSPASLSLFSFLYPNTSARMDAVPVSGGLSGRHLR